MGRTIDRRAGVPKKRKVYKVALCFDALMPYRLVVDIDAIYIRQRVDVNGMVQQLSS